MSSGAAARSSTLAALGIRVVDDFFDAGLVSELREVCSSAEFLPASLYQGDEVRVDEAQRRTKELLVPTEVRKRARNLFRAEIEQVNRWYATTIDDCAHPSFLRYQEGDFFVAHTDRSPRRDDPDPIGRRAVSAVVFLNGRDDPGFEGGELLFSPFDDPVWNTRGFELQPQAGRLVLFPSTMIHEVKAVRSGERLTVVTWFQNAAGAETAPPSSAACVNAAPAPAGEPLEEDRGSSPPAG